MSAIDINESNKRHRAEDAPLHFADAGQQNFTGVYHRDNSDFLRLFGPKVLLTRPPQLGKSTLLAVAEAMYSRAYNKQNPPPIGSISALTLLPENEKGFVFIVDFLPAAGFGNNLSRSDSSVFDIVKSGLRTFQRKHPELEQHLPSKEDVGRFGHPGAVLDAVCQAVADFNSKSGSNIELFILVDEYDAPVRYSLLDAIGSTDGRESWMNLTTSMSNYCNFFVSCKSITSPYSQTKTNIWLTGVTHIALELISGFEPTNITFNANFANVLGYEEKHVREMLALVNERTPFASKQQMDTAFEAVEQIANRLYFLKGIPLFHTRVVNGLMKALSDEYMRTIFLANRELPPDAKFDEIPKSLLKVINHRSHRDIFVAVRTLAVGGDTRDFHLNTNLNLADVAQPIIKVNDYLTLLVHLGAASVTQQATLDGTGVQTIFRPTSAYHRQPLFQALVNDTMGYLMTMRALDDIYGSGARLIEDFMLTLPKSSMASLVSWAEKERRNHILELQFQGYVVGRLSDLLLNVAQEKSLPESGRTDVTLSNDHVLVVLELKQKPEARPHALSKMREYHEHLKPFVAEHVQIEKGKGNPRLVAGFVVAMYDSGTKFQVERTTYVYS